ncbi:MAG: cell envelope integrity protein TolA [Candidatus Altimarinota bacterium]
MMNRKKIFVYIFSLLLSLGIFSNINTYASSTTTSTSQKAIQNQDVLDNFLKKVSDLRKSLNDDTKYGNALISLEAQIKTLEKKYSHNSTIGEMTSYLSSGLSKLRKELDVANFLCELNGNCNTTQTGTTTTTQTSTSSNNTTTSNSSINSCKYTYSLQDFNDKNCSVGGGSIRSSSATNLSDYALIKEGSKGKGFYCQYIHDTFSRKYILQSDNGSCNVGADQTNAAAQNAAQNDLQKAQAEQAEKEKEAALIKQQQEEAAKQKEIADRLTFASYSKEAKAGEQVTLYWKAGESYNGCYLTDKINAGIFTSSFGVTVGTDARYTYTMPENNTTIILKCKRGTSFNENFSEKEVQINIKK